MTLLHTLVNFRNLKFQRLIQKKPRVSNFKSRIVQDYKLSGRIKEFRGKVERGESGNGKGKTLSTIELIIKNYRNLNNRTKIY